jgi:hypothetical protein
MSDFGLQPGIKKEVAVLRLLTRSGHDDSNNGFRSAGHRMLYTAELMPAIGCWVFGAAIPKWNLAAIEFAWQVDTLVSSLIRAELSKVCICEEAIKVAPMGHCGLFLPGGGACSRLGNCRGIL